MKYKARQQGYKVLGSLSPDELLPHTGPAHNPRKFFGHLVKVKSLRYQTFKNSLKCVCCGLMGEVFLLELPPQDKRPHFNLYAYCEGSLVQMTKDHKQPKSKGGKDVISNMQTMCCRCNELKGNQLSKLKRLRKIQDGVQTVYMVMRHDRPVSDNFATSRKGLAEIMSQEIMEFYGWDEGEFQVRVSIRLLTIEVRHGKGRKPLKFGIKPIRRI
jgi:hypothetical protein